MSELRDTLHDFSIDYVRALAEVFGWEVVTAKGSEPGPDIVVIHKIGDVVDAVMFIESEVGHDQGGAQRYFERLCERLKPLVKRYKENYGERILFRIVIITNAPRRLTAYLRSNRRELEARLGFPLIEGWTIFIVPVLLFREVLPAVFVRAMGATARYAG